VFSISIAPAGVTPPSFTPSNLSLWQLEATSAVVTMTSLPNWASAIRATPVSTSTVGLTFSIRGISDVTFFAVPPAVAISPPSVPGANATLSFGVAAYRFGLVTFRVVLVNAVTGQYSDEYSISLTVANVNQPPSFQLTSQDVSIMQGQGLYRSRMPLVSTISAGPNEDSSQAVNFVCVCVVTSPPSGVVLSDIFATLPSIDRDGFISLTTTASGSGTASCQATAVDTGGTANGGRDTSLTSRVFLVTVRHINQPPSFRLLGGGDVTLNAPWPHERRFHDLPRLGVAHIRW